MIYKCPKCGSEIRFWCFEQSTNCDCEQCTANFYDAKDAENYARLLDSERWRKISDEKPVEGEGYSHVLCRVEFGKLYELSFAEVKQIIDSIDVDMYPNAEWRPVYGC